ncbi:alpha/beta-hydrolase [Crepidotus variabilis]|uniref:Carboxylic ester hydrolase n=1 Tax=Crepidotus variabilis TaxID=179855 RepID=A0A9P6E4N9_9AGAR|nr:alpha/beta-hydrolase [Crepidotus variabilis]
MISPKSSSKKLPLQYRKTSRFKCGFWLPTMFFSAFFLLLTTLAYRDSLFAWSTLLPASFIENEESQTIAKPARLIVDTGYARYLGNQTFPNTVAYLGIPYAEPPLGDRRFRRPLPLDEHRVKGQSLTVGQDGVIDARSYPEFCIQGSTGGGDAGGAGSEDCLKVNIYTPADANKSSKLPVLVYIHGGGYIFGNPRNWPFDHWVQQSPNVVIVSVYYRLSSFGFLATSAFAEDSSLGDLNAGFLDQVQALKWVNKNIEAFGGDPDKVTINGESAGGSSVELHLVANGGSSKLFHGAIAQSVYRTPLPQPDQQDTLFDFFASIAECKTSNIKTTMACLRRADISVIAKAQDTALYNLTSTGYKTFHPVIDGKILSDYPTKLIKAGKFAKVPLIIGATSNETLSGGTDITIDLKKYFPSISDEDINALLLAYPQSSFVSSGERHDALTGDSELRCARTIMATAFGAYHNSWTYRYNQPTPGAPKVYHAAENWMMFKGTATGYNGSTTFQPQSAANEAFAEELIAYWLSFVRSGDPNTFKLSHSPKWEIYKSNTERIVLQQPEDGSVATSGSYVEEEGQDIQRCQIVERQADTQQN